MANQAIARFENHALSSPDTGKSIDAARRSFQIIEPWSQASSQNYQVQSVLRAIKQEVQSYYRSIDQSLKTAQAGYSLANDAQTLCDCLLEPKGTYTARELRDYIEDMQRKARTAHSEARAVSNMFRANRQNFFEITKTIPTTIASIRSQQQTSNREMAVSRRQVGFYNTVQNTAGYLSAGSAAAVVAVGVAAAPLALIALPILLPIFALVVGVMKYRSERAVAVRESKSMDSATAISQLKGTLTYLTQLGTEIDTIAKYWGEMDTILQNIHDDVEAIQADRIVRIKIGQIKKQWGEVEGRYLDYKTGIAQLQDFFPASKIGY